MHPQTWSLDPTRILTRRELSMVLADAATNADQTPTCSSVSDRRFACRKTKRPRPYRNGQGRRDLLGFLHVRALCLPGVEFRPPHGGGREPSYVDVADVLQKLDRRKADEARPLSLKIVEDHPGAGVLVHAALNTLAVIGPGARPESGISVRKGGTMTSDDSTRLSLQEM